MIEGGFILICGSALGIVCMCKAVKKYVNKCSSKYPALRNTRNTTKRNIIYVTSPYNQDNIYNITPNAEDSIFEEPPPPYSEK